MIIYFVIILLLILLLKSRLNTSLNNRDEEFYQGMCFNCNQNGWQNKDECFLCPNCGWSVGFDGFGQCIPGNVRGPFQMFNTRDWYYNKKKIWTRADLRELDYRNQVNPRVVLNSIPRIKLITPRNMDYKYRNRMAYGKRLGRRFGYGEQGVFGRQPF